MSDFKDRLWRDLVRDHGDELARVRRPAAGDGRRVRPRVLAGTTLGLAGVGTALALVLGATGSSPAFAVNRNPDGTVFVRIDRPEAIAAANARLAALGIRVRAVQVIAGCAVHLRGREVEVPSAGALPPNAVVRAVRGRRQALVSVAVDPRRIRRGATLVLAARPGFAHPPKLLAKTVRGVVPPCAGSGPWTAGPPPLPKGATVVCTSNGRTVSGPAARALMLAQRKRVEAAHVQSTGDSGNSGTSGDSGNSGTSGKAAPPPPGATPGHPTTCQIHPMPGTAGSSGNSGNSGDSGPSGNSGNSGNS